MTIVTHSIATIVTGKLLGIGTTRDWFLAFLFGVLIDLDHLKIFRPKHMNNGDWGRYFNRELPMRSFFQEPIFIFFVVPLSFLINNPSPMATWSVHLFLDYLVDGVKRPFWPISKLTLKSGILPAYSFYELLLFPIALLVFIF